MADFGNASQVVLSPPSPVIPQQLLPTMDDHRSNPVRIFPGRRRSGVLFEDEQEEAIECRSALDSAASVLEGPVRGPGARVHILLADDHETVRTGVRVILASRKEYDLVEVANGEEAVNAARTSAPDLVI